MNAAAGRPRPFPWDEVMAIGFGLLRLSPAAFWMMTPREFECAARLLSGPGAPERSAVLQMMAMFPDRPGGRA